ncbi:Hypothetical predicted protein [Pelobates cultripes]|uniref:Reverse transcriptase domain-containing protein n=1 Tax=Pelobates cultripes TaxID=61616 RepID=A0AAD1RNP5_PELCU|nr:Hypothetical predicted protein [Pelobates cultripes]
MAINDLKNNHAITIKPADKGGAVVIMNTKGYIKEGDRQLSDDKYYRKLNEDPTKEYTSQLRELIKSFPENLHLELQSLIPTSPCMGTFYMLPKIHKTGNPGRPIIPGMGTLTEQISGLVENTLKPLVTNTNSFIKDTADFLNKLSQITNLPANTILVTMDVESLYSNIPHTDGINACYHFLSHVNNQKYSPRIITELALFILTHNYFCFNNEVYLQTMGTAMGTTMAPQYANLFMADLEQRFLEIQHTKPYKYYHYIDDIFIVWTESEEKLIQFHDSFNTFHPSIKLKMEYSTRSVNFLDTTVTCNNGTIHTSVYRKPTDRCSYLHSSSFHPSHTKQGIIHSQATRYHRICSDPNDRNSHLNVLSKSMRQKGYKPTTITKQINSAVKTPRMRLLQYREKKISTRVPLVVTYNPALEEIRKIFKDLQSILTEDETLKNIFPETPILAFRQPPNLQQK